MTPVIYNLSLLQCATGESRLIESGTKDGLIMNVMYKMSSILCSTTKVLWTEVLLALLLDSWHRYFMVKNCEDHQQHHHLHILQSKKSLAKRQASFISINISAAAAAVMGRASRCEKYSL